MAIDQPEIEKMEIMASFFSYWQSPDVEIYRELDSEQFKKLSQPIRHKILSILSMGIMDDNPLTKQRMRRHVLSAPEILEQLKKQHDMPEVKKSNLYFHLQILEDEGVITVVDQIPTGKRFTTYYGRTSKIFYVKNSPDIQVTMEKRINEFSMLRQGELKELILRMNPGQDLGEIETALSLADRINVQDPELFKKWIKKNQQYTEGLDINFIAFHEFLSILNRYNEETIIGLSKLSKMLHLSDLE